MDIYCPKCGEPWEMDSIHEAIDDEFGNVWPTRKAMIVADAVNRGQSESQGRNAAQDVYEKEYYNQMRDRFRTEGCVALGGRRCVPNNSMRAMASDALMDLMGDDLDGVASMMDDADQMGLF